MSCCPGYSFQWLFGGLLQMKSKWGLLLKCKPNHSFPCLKTLQCQRINSQLFSLVDKAVQKLPPLQPSIWLSFSGKPQQLYNCSLVTLSSPVLYLCNFGVVSGCHYPTTPKTPQTALTAPPTSSGGLSFSKARRANALFFPIPTKEFNPRHLSKCFLSDRQGRSSFAYQGKMLPRRESEG